MADFTIKGGRSYVHDECGKATLVTGKDFPGLCNPFEPCLGTMCANCGISASTKNFKWEDTGECISDYRKRQHKEASVFIKAFHYVVGPLIAAVIGGVTGNIFGGAGGIIGALAGIAFMFMFFGPMIADAFGNFWKKP